MSKPLRIVFAGTPDFAAKHLSSLINSNHQVVAVYTQPDRPAGRGKKLQLSPVKQLALDFKLPVYQPQSLKTPEAQQELATLDFDIMVVVAYGLILPKAVLDIPKLGCLNVHGSILPKWRGAAPIQRAIWAGDSETGITIMQMDEGLDTGDMLLKKTIPIEATDTSASMYDKLAELGPVGLLETLDNITTISPETQNNDQASYAKKLEKTEGLIDWHQDAMQLHRNIRAFTPWPGTWFELKNRSNQVQNIKVWDAIVTDKKSSLPPGSIVSVDKSGLSIQTGTYILKLIRLQVPGKKQQPFADILNAKPDWFVEGQKPGETS